MLARVLLALLAGGSLSVAFEPVAWPYLLPFSLAGFALVTRGPRARSAWLPGLAFGAGFYLAHIWWMRSAIGPDAWIALSATEAVFYAALGSVAAWLHRLRAWPVWLAAAWATIEVVRSGWPLSGMPWGRLSFAVVDTPAAPGLAYLGLTGLSFLLAALGFSLAGALVARGARQRGLALLAVLAIGCAIALPSVVPLRLPQVGQITVAAVQGDVPGPGNNVLYDPRGLTENHVEATVELADAVAAGAQPAPDFVVWPENSTAVDPFDDPVVNAAIRRAVAAIGVPVLVGGLVDLGSDELLNQGIVWDPRTGAGERYTKQNPVPYGEFIPWRGRMPQWFLEAGRLGEIGRDMQAGDRTTPMSIAGVPIADAICFDVAYEGGIYAQVRNGAELLVVQTSNASFIFTDQIDQQFAMTRLRAIETGRWLVVASTNGLSGVIAPDGEVVATAPRQEPAVLLEEVGLISAITPGVRIGRWSSWGLAGLMLLGLALAWRGRTPGHGGDRVKNDGAYLRGGTIDKTSSRRGGQVDGRRSEQGATRHARQPRAVMVMPTYQEADNLAWIVGRLRSASPDVDVLVVDDASPDGTGRIAEELAGHDAAVHVLHRPAKAGLGAAYLAGFAWALQRGYPAVGEMDADGSHAPEQLGRLLDALGPAGPPRADSGDSGPEGADLVIGSRYVPGGAVHHWPLHRQALSRGGNLYVRLLLGLPVHDATAGYRVFRREALELMDLDGVRSLGYVFQTDLAARAVRAGLRVREVPIDFVERTRGHSKMDPAVALESLRLITRWGLAVRRDQVRSRLGLRARARREQTVPSR